MAAHTTLSPPLPHPHYGCTHHTLSSLSPTLWLHTPRLSPSLSPTLWLHTLQSLLLSLTHTIAAHTMLSLSPTLWLHTPRSLLLSLTHTMATHTTLSPPLSHPHCGCSHHALSPLSHSLTLSLSHSPPLSHPNYGCTHHNLSSSLSTTLWLHTPRSLPPSLHPHYGCSRVGYTVEVCTYVFIVSVEISTPCPSSLLYLRKMKDWQVYTVLYNKHGRHSLVSCWGSN